MEKTAVEWLIEQLKTRHNINIEILSITDKAKGMEREQIIKSYLWDRFPCSDEEAEQYYNITFNAAN